MRRRPEHHAGAPREGELRQDGERVSWSSTVPVSVSTHETPLATAYRMNTPILAFTADTIRPISVRWSRKVLSSCSMMISRETR